MHFFFLELAQIFLRQDKFLRHHNIFPWVHVVGAIYRRQGVFVLRDGRADFSFEITAVASAGTLPS